jgi:uncharacterized RDD family membrane protein YckC
MHVDQSGLPLASPWLRLVAVIVDGIIMFPISLVLGMLFGMPSFSAQMEASRIGAEALKAIMPSVGVQLLVQVLSIVVFIAVNFVFLKNGQTIGKKVLKLQIQKRSDSSLLPVQDLIVKRMLPVYIVGALYGAVSQLIGILLTVDALLIFRKGRNTLHDDIANSKVVKLPG